MKTKLCHFCVEFWEERCEFCHSSGCERCEPQEATKVAKIDQEEYLHLCDRHALAFRIAFVRIQMESANAGSAATKEVH